MKKYSKCAGQVEIELNWLYNWIPALISFVRYLCKVYDNEEVTKDMNIRQDIDMEWVLSFFV